MDILLHICCGPCLIYPFSRLKDQGFKISGFYYNPNIYPLSEYRRREEALKILSQEFALEVEYAQYQESDFFQRMDPPGKTLTRCRSCWSWRLQRTAEQAKQKGLAAFSTTLLVSPYQDHEQLKQLGRQIGQAAGIDFYYEDFRSGFRQAQMEAKRRGIYRQKYCGCQYSMRSRLASASSGGG